jgi:erythromycin esterase
MQRSGYINIGGLAREQYGAEQVRLIGFATSTGTVMAAPQWGAAGTVMHLPEPPLDSLEGQMHAAIQRHCVLPLRELDDDDRQVLDRTIVHRAIGVVYDPARERFGNYVPTELSSRYDALIYLDSTKAVQALPIYADPAEEPEAYPSGL